MFIAERLVIRRPRAARPEVNYRSQALDDEGPELLSRRYIVRAKGSIPKTLCRSAR